MNLTHSSDFSLQTAAMVLSQIKANLISCLSTLHEKEMDSGMAEQTPLAFRGLSPVQLHRYSGMSLTFHEDI